jgi:hypothetical protein
LTTDFLRAFGAGFAADEFFAKNRDVRRGGDVEPNSPSLNSDDADRHAVADHDHFAFLAS